MRSKEIEIFFTILIFLFMVFGSYLFANWTSDEVILQEYWRKIFAIRDVRYLSIVLFFFLALYVFFPLMLWMLRLDIKIKSSKAIRFIRFGIVGGSGLVLTLFGVAFFTEIMNLHYVLSAVIMSAIGFVYNYTLNQYWTFGDSLQKTSHISVGKFIVTTAAYYVLYYILLLFFTERMEIFYLISVIMSVGVCMTFKYAMACTWIWKIDSEEISGLFRNLSEIMKVKI